MPRPRTPRPSQTSFTRPAPAAVTYDLSIPDQATITVPRGSTWSSGPHWHEAHTEFLEVLAGRARVRLGGKTVRVGRGEGVVVIPRGVVHEWLRDDVVGEHEGEDIGEGGEEDGDLIVREWTEPKDGMKEVFFRNLNGLILDAAGDKSGGWRSGVVLEVELWNLFWRADNYPVIWNGGWVGRVATKVVMGVAVALGWVFGWKGVYEEYGLRR
ncbi:uncharacterized protein GGS22DRAFT_41611 [Annulohypoxylon maeteangense]|uniref:uncharacterized protein n=1 Tax=Annulohypoxylon maeteangense TaxID=1927788 RepID=UPI00200894DC|nr:uncharacterized protein GGS22DRAFT_41611 [Annulohypoxylon maeteangense]KAI0882838.1 hypothetical protein GGS22DRAFT_41611 [Annulohypoxylon maeteangense]